MRRGPRYCIVLIGLLAGSLLGIRAAGAANGDESQFVSRINSERTSRGEGRLAWSENLGEIARRHSQEMADQNDLHHNSNLPNEVHGWQMLGENVGYGGSVDQLHDAFMNSPEHRDNILEPGYTLIGVGTVWRGSTLWVTEVFERPQSASSGSSQSVRRHRVRTVTPPVTQRPLPPGPSAPRPAVPATPPAAALRPQAAENPVGDLTRFMVESLLSRQEPAATSIYAPAGVFLDSASVSLSFQPFARMVGQVNRSLLLRTAKR